MNESLSFVNITFFAGSPPGKLRPAVYWHCHYARSFCNQIIIRSIICELLKRISLDDLANLLTITLIIREYFSTWKNSHNSDCSSLIAAEEPPGNECCRFENPASPFL